MRSKVDTSLTQQNSRIVASRTLTKKKKKNYTRELEPTGGYLLNERSNHRLLWWVEAEDIVTGIPA
jgi:hypothetical protein